MKRRVGLMWHGDRATRDTVKMEDTRLGPTAAVFAEAGLQPEGVVYNDDFADEVREQLLALDAVQVWVNPITGDQDRTKLDAVLRDVAAQGVLVYTHPDT